MKKFLALAALTAVAFSAAADIYEYEPGPFDKLVVRADIDIVYRNVPDSTGFIRYESDRDYSGKLDVSCSKGKLSIIDKFTEEEYGPLPKLYLYSDYLTSVSYEGTQTALIDMVSATPTFSVKLTGNGKVICNGIHTTDFSANIVTGNGTIVARGNCSKAKFTVTGTGTIQADQLNADEVKCSLLGTGSIGCRAIDSLEARGIGNSKIYYYGNPTIKKSGGVTLEQMPEEEDTEAIKEHEEETPMLTERKVTVLPVSSTEPDEAGLDD